MSRNVEIKARVAVLEALKKLAESMCGVGPTVLKQHDIFYNSPHERLKLRSIQENGAATRAELIWYSRPNSAGPKLSEYKKMDVDEAKLEDTKDILRLSMGIKGEVRKTRYLFMYEQTRIHVDSVEGLGDFMELEVCLRPEQSVEEGVAIAHAIRKELQIGEEALLEGAYMDMLKA